MNPAVLAIGNGQGTASVLAVAISGRLLPAVVARGLSEANVPNSSGSSSELARDLNLRALELFGPRTDVNGECLGFSMARGPFCWGSAASVGDRQVFSDSEPRILRIFDAIQDSSLGGANVTGAIAGYSSRLP